jgi:voltage-gated sodium channel
LSVTERCRRWVASAVFQRGILGAILVGAVTVGLETYPELMARHGQLILTIDWIVIGVFCVEALLKMAQHGRRWWRYFLDPWNIFDFTILAVCLLPLDGHYAAVLRLARVLRAMRLISALPRLQLLVSALLKSLPSMTYVGLLLVLLFYVYGVLGVALFRDNDPVHFGNLKLALLSLFRVVTLEDWTDIMYIQMYGSDVFPIDNPAAVPTDPTARPVLGAAYFVSFVMLGTMIMLNLFIGVIINSMHEAQEEAENEARRRRTPRQIGDEMTELTRRLEMLGRELRSMKEPPTVPADPAGDRRHDRT